MKNLKKKLLSKTLGKHAYWTLNKQLVKTIGLEASLILQHIIDLQNVFEKDEIFQSQPDMAKELGISEYAVKNRIPELVELGLISVIKKGVPCKNYYSTNDDKILEILVNGLDSSKSTDLTVDLNKLTDSDIENNLQSVENNFQSVRNQRTGDSEIDTTITNNTDKEYKTNNKINNTSNNTNPVLNTFSEYFDPSLPIMQYDEEEDTAEDLFS